MPMLWNELPAQQFEQARVQLKRRRKNRISVIASMYAFFAIAGAVTAAIGMEGVLTSLLITACAVAMTTFLAIGVHSIFEIRRSNRALDKSLDVIAAMRGMAYQANAPKAEFDRITNQYRALLRERSRRLVGLASKFPILHD